MLLLRQPISPALAAELEAYFCEDYQDCWALEEDFKTRTHELIGYFRSVTAAEAAHGILRQQFPSLEAAPEPTEVPDKSWEDSYKIHFQAWSDRGLHFVPVWERATYVVPPGEDVIWLDPGMAFGTGNHETTRLCLRRLIDAKAALGAQVEDLSVLDAGCGSGILAIAAKKLGWGTVEGFDIDPDSTRISLENAALCELDGQIHFWWADLEAGLKDRTADLVLANILADVLLDYADELLNAVRPGGQLALSGILVEQLPPLKIAFRQRAKALWGGVAADDARLDDEWADYWLQRPA